MLGVLKPGPLVRALFGQFPSPLSPHIARPISLIPPTCAFPYLSSSPDAHLLPDLLSIAGSTYPALTV